MSPELLEQFLFESAIVEVGTGGLDERRAVLGVCLPFPKNTVVVFFVRTLPAAGISFAEETWYASVPVDPEMLQVYPFDASIRSGKIDGEIRLVLPMLGI